MSGQPKPTEIRLHQQSRMLEIAFDDGNRYQLSCEYLRGFSPSAEVRGHGPGQETLQTGKERVNIEKLEPVGAYAVRLHFDDGHSTGLYSWETFYELGRHQSEYWQAYLDRLAVAGYTREEPAQL